MTTISIIIPSYNQQDYLCEAIESAINQTVKPLEIIVIDDGSTDNSLEIARRYPVTVISQVNKGLSSARNTGIMWSSGDYILPLDADDILKDNAIEILVKTIEETKADIVAPSFRTFGVSNQNVILLDKPTLDDFKIANRIAYCSAIRREAIMRIGGYSPRMIHGYEDYHVWFNLLSRGYTLSTISDVLFLYRTKEHSMIHDAMKHHEELMAQIKKDFPNVWQN